MHTKHIRLGMAVLLVLLLVSTGILIGCKPAEKAPPPPAEKKITQYNIAVYLDYTGPYAEIAPDIEGASKVALTWWNETKGKELGIKLVPKYYDFRYDSAVCASQHPSVISELKPIAILEDGIPYCLALMKQLAIDKVPAIHLTGGYEFMNSPGGWIFVPLSSYMEQCLAFLDWWAKTKGPVNFACKGFDTPPWQTGQNIIDAYSKQKGYTFKGVKFTGNIEPNMVPSVMWLLDQKPDFVFDIESVYNTVVLAKAMVETGAKGKFALVYSLHEGLAEVGRVVGYETIEGYYMVTPVDFLSTTGRGQKIWYENAGRIAPGLTLQATTCRGLANSLILTQAVEKAAATVGADKLTGQVIYDTLNAGSFTGMDLCDDVQIDPQDRLRGVKGVKAYQMVKGKIVDITGGTGWTPLAYFGTKWLYPK